MEESESTVPDGAFLNPEGVKLKKFKLLKQKYLHTFAEDVELREYFQKLGFLKTRLKEIQKALYEWTVKLTVLSNSAKTLSSVFETSDDVVRTVIQDMKDNKHTEMIMKDIAQKLQLVQNLLQERKHIKLLKLNLDRAERKYQHILSKRRISQKRRSKRLYKRDIAAESYSNASIKLLGKLKFVLDGSSSSNDGPNQIHLITPELNAFVAAQAQILLDCQKLINGPYERLSDQYAWEEINNMISDNVNRAMGSQKADEYSNQLNQKISKSKKQPLAYHKNKNKKEKIKKEADKSVLRSKTKRGADGAKLHVGMQNLCVQEMWDVTEDIQRYRGETNDSSEYDYCSDDSYSDYDIDASYVIRK